MGVWNATTPAAGDVESGGASKLREMKTAIEEALSHESSTFPGASPSTAPIFVPGFLRGATGSRPTGDSLVTGRLYDNTTLNVVERYNGTSWDAVATNLPSGTKMMFYQASVPTGWTAVALNDKFLRVVNGAGTGGTSGGSGLVPSDTIALAHTHTANHTHTISADGSHTHTITSVAVILNGSAWSTTSSTALSHDHGAATGSADAITDNALTDTAFQYADAVLGTKD